MTTNEVAEVRSNRKLIAGAAVTAVLATTLIWAGWRLTGTTTSWHDLGDPNHWFGQALRAAGALLFGKTGLKLGLVVVAVAIGAVMWARSTMQSGRKDGAGRDGDTAGGGLG
ncbi:hypothetical protein [Catenuloplanes atrovinosus]|uniref:Uncharacterized protein n=1 Tax=Catenuloplanes atrovinosus TaxID=137266 RepID=A0AAE3YU78_9ACTN|nr:hypothetical protein [Catenuloplanes atrovinosus]MDR7278710.1 hypothetical protein [Catenuloplanes atrovinosus]